MKKIVFFIIAIAAILAGAYFFLPRTLLSQVNLPLPLEDADISVYAPTSLKGVFKELTPLFEDEHEGLTLSVTYGSSQELTQKINEGAIPDLFISSSLKDMTELARNKKLIGDSRKNLTMNTLVLIGPPDTKLVVIESLKSPRIYTIAIGNPETVPAGEYALTALKNLNLYDELSYKLVYEDNMSDLMKGVEDKTVNCGIVFRSDAMTSDKVKIVQEFPVGTYNFVVYQMAQILNNENPKQTDVLEEFLLSQEAQEVFTKFGFTKAANNESE